MWPSQRLASIGLDSGQGVLTGEGTDGESGPSSRYLKREHFSHSSLELGPLSPPCPQHVLLLGATTGKDGTIYAIGGRGPAGVTRAR